MKLRPTTSLGSAVPVFLLAASALTSAQAPSSTFVPSALDLPQLSDQTFHLNPTASATQLNETLIVLRQILAKPYHISPVDGENAFVVSGTPAQLKLTQKILDDTQPTRPSPGTKLASAPFPVGPEATVHATDELVAEQTFYLPANTSTDEANKLGMTLRQTIKPTSKIYVLPTLHAIVLNALPDQLALTQETMARILPSWSETAPHAASPVYSGQTRGTYTDQLIEQAFYLPAKTDRQASVEVLVALRNAMSPEAKISLFPSTNAIIIAATPNQMALASKILADLEPTLVSS